MSDARVFESSVRVRDQCLSNLDASEYSGHVRRACDTAPHCKQTCLELEISRDAVHTQNSKGAIAVQQRGPKWVLAGYPHYPRFLSHSSNASMSKVPGMNVLTFSATARVMAER